MNLSNINIKFGTNHLTMINNIKEEFLAELEEITRDEELDTEGQEEWCNMYINQALDSEDFVTAMVINTIKERLID